MFLKKRILAAVAALGVTLAAQSAYAEAPVQANTGLAVRAAAKQPVSTFLLIKNGSHMGGMKMNGMSGMGHMKMNGMSGGPGMHMKNYGLKNSYSYSGSFHRYGGRYRRGRGYFVYGYPYGDGYYGYGGGSCYWNCRQSGYGPGYCHAYAYNFCDY